MATEKNCNSSDASKRCSNKKQSSAKACGNSKAVKSSNSKKNKVMNKPDYDQYGTGKYSDCFDDTDDCLDLDD